MAQEQAVAQVIRYHRQFRANVQAYAEWFQEQQPGPCDQFVDVAIHQLESRPLSHRTSWNHYRRALIRSFRIVIPFDVDDAGIFVHGLVHGTRDLPGWMTHRERDA